MSETPTLERNPSSRSRSVKGALEHSPESTRPGTPGKRAGRNKKSASALDPSIRKRRTGKKLTVRAVRSPRLGRPSRRTAAIGVQFGVPLYGSPTTIVERTDLQIGPGKLIFLTGPSGSGKSTALAEIERQFAGGVTVDRIAFPPEAAVIDAIAPWGTLADALSLLTACGLGEAPLWVRRFCELSEGERFRARLARGLALHGRNTPKSPLLCDEFCALLHRRVARAISHCLRRIVTRRKLCVVVASSHDDIIADLQPDTVLRFQRPGHCVVESRAVSASRPFSMRRRVNIEPGGKRDYNAFASMHYRATDELGFVDKVFVMRFGTGGDPVGVIVYSHPSIELAMRNRATAGRFSRKPKLLNHSVRVLRRLVIHPDIRGCGLGHHFVRKTLPMIGTEYVECLAGMGECNPVFEKAGMTRIGQYEVSAKNRAALEALQAMGMDPHARDFAVQVCRRRRVREIVAQVVRDWYAATTGDGQKRVARQSPQFLAQTFRGLIGSRPVYYLWKRPDAA